MTSTKRTLTVIWTSTKQSKDIRLLKAESSLIIKILMDEYFTALPGFLWQQILFYIVNTWGQNHCNKISKLRFKLSVF